VVGFGQASDMFAFAPNAQLTSIIDEWAPYYVARTRAVLDGTWESTDTWDGIAPGMVKMAEYTNMPDEVAALAMETEAMIASGELHPFTGPIYNQEGEMVIGEGEALDDGTLLRMDWYVQGVDDKLPE
jgi:simple sugar transport system substrate-binding protein